MWAMFKKRSKTKVHIANFEEGDRNAQVSIEFDSTVKTQRPLGYQLAIGLIKLLLFPFLLPFKIIWYILKNIVSE
jgi:hypothetical protein